VLTKRGFLDKFYATTSDLRSRVKRVRDSLLLALKEKAASKLNKL